MVDVPMDIYSKQGSKVMVTSSTVSNGYTSDSDRVRELCEIDKPYTINHTEVGRYMTDIYLEEFPNIRFNSVNFVNV